VNFLLRHNVHLHRVKLLEGTDVVFFSYYNWIAVTEHQVATPSTCEWEEGPGLWSPVRISIPRW